MVLGYQTCVRMSIKVEHTPRGISKGASKDKGWVGITDVTLGGS